MNSPSLVDLGILRKLRSLDWLTGAQLERPMHLATVPSGFLMRRSLRTSYWESMLKPISVATS